MFTVVKFCEVLEACEFELRIYAASEVWARFIVRVVLWFDDVFYYILYTMYYFREYDRVRLEPIHMPGVVLR